MDQETFEESISAKFEGKAIKAPKNVWNNVSGALNNELVIAYASQNIRYRRIAIAAVLIAVLSFAFQFHEIESSESNSILSDDYNALLSKGFDTYLFRGDLSSSTDQMTFLADFEKKKDVSHNSSFSPITPEPHYNDFYAEAIDIRSIKPEIEEANITTNDIYRYHTLHAYHDIDRSTKSGTKLWAGVQAGAGTFNSGIENSNALSNSVNPSGLASVVGASEFVNPTSSMTQDMDEAVATTVGFDFGLQMGRKWTLESGVAYTSLNNGGSASINVLDVYTINEGSFIEGRPIGGLDGPIQGQSLSASRNAAIEVEETFDHNIDLSNTVRFTSVPLKAGYFVVDDRFSLKVNAGIAANYLMEGSISDATSQIINENNLGLYNEWSFDGLGGLEFGYSVFDKFDLTLEPNYLYAIRPISTNATNPSRFILQTGLRYTLK